MVLPWCCCRNAASSFFVLASVERYTRRIVGDQQMYRLFTRTPRQQPSWQWMGAEINSKPVNIIQKHKTFGKFHKQKLSKTRFRLLPCKTRAFTICIVHYWQFDENGRVPENDSCVVSFVDNTMAFVTTNVKRYIHKQRYHNRIMYYFCAVLIFIAYRHFSYFRSNSVACKRCANRTNDRINIFF